MPDAASGFCVTQLTRLTARLVPHDWAWARDNADAIAAHWRRRRAERPALFDGRVLVARGWSIADGACTVDLFETAFSAFLCHRDLGWPDRSVANAFAAVVPHAADGGVLLGIMGGHTASAGRIYFPCGTPDLADLRADGAVDLAGSATREFTEETGLTPPPEASEAWLFLRDASQCAFLRPVAFREDAAVLHARMEAHRAGEAEPELSGFVVVRSRAGIDASRMSDFAVAYLAQCFAA